MIGRLSAFDLPGRLERRMPRAVVQVTLGVLLAALAFAIRAAVELVAPGVIPFALLFPAILLATGLAGWKSGAVALVAGGLFSWRFLPLAAPWDAARYADEASLILYAVSGALVIAAAAAYRATALALRDSQQRLELAASAAKVGVWEWRLATSEMIYSDEARRIYGFALDRPLTYEIVASCVHPDDWPATDLQVRRALDPELRDDSAFEYRIITEDGQVRWIYAMGRAVFEPGKAGDAAARYVGTLQDITARKLDEERLRLLAREVDHRANNLLAVVQGTVALSEAEDAPALKSVIAGRVNALARAHQLLAQARWEGADLRRLVDEELLAFSLGDDVRVSVGGPPVALAPAAAQAVAMALHELATNAAKYGALSVPEGRVEVIWSREPDGGVRLGWRESGGPAVETPTRHGLGTTLLRRALSGPIGGQTTLDWRPDGLACELLLPAAAQEPAHTVHGAQEAEVVAEPTPQSVQ